MSELLNDIRKATQNMKCSEHGKKAEVTIKGDKISISACCEKFRDKIGEVAKKASTDSVKKQIKNIFKK